MKCVKFMLRMPGISAHPLDVSVKQFRMLAAHPNNMLPTVTDKSIST